MNIRGYEWLIILLIVLLLFGATRLPALARSLGQTWRIFRKEVRTTDDDTDTTDDPTKTPPPR